MKSIPFMIMPYGKRRVRPRPDRASRASISTRCCDSVGASTPPAVSPGKTFVARFAAYTDAYRGRVKAVTKREAPTSRLRLDLGRCRWYPGTKVTVRLDSGHATVSNPVRTFSWDGSYEILRFDVTVANKVPADTIILRFDVAVESMPIISLRREIKIDREQQYGGPSALASFVEVRAPGG
jgi:hypothetical protein